MREDDKMPKQARSLETREKIVETGLKLFCEEGYQGTNSKKIAKAAGVAIGTFYNHFKDKKALLLEIHTRHSRKVHQELAQFFNQLPAFDRNGFNGPKMMRQVVALVYRTHELGPELHREIGILSQTDSDFAKMSVLEKEAAHAKLNEVLSPHFNRMRVSDLDVANWIIGMCMETVIHSVIMSPPKMEATRILDELADMLSRYLFE